MEWRYVWVILPGLLVLLVPFWFGWRVFGPTVLSGLGVARASMRATASGDRDEDVIPVPDAPTSDPESGSDAVHEAPPLQSTVDDFAVALAEARSPPSNQGFIVVEEGDPPPLSISWASLGDVAHTALLSRAESAETDAYELSAPDRRTADMLESTRRRLAAARTAGELRARLAAHVEPERRPPAHDGADDTSERRAIAARLAAVERRLADREAALARLQGVAERLARTESLLAEREAELAIARQKLDDGGDRRDEFEGRRHDVSESIGTPSVRPSPERIASRIEVREPVRPARLFEPVEARDDLKRIRGIGPVMERLLNDIGVTSFAQLAAFTPEDVRRVAAVIETFPGRIERDDWVGQASAHERRESDARG